MMILLFSAHCSIEFLLLHQQKKMSQFLRKRRSTGYLLHQLCRHTDVLFHSIWLSLDTVYQEKNAYFFFLSLYTLLNYIPMTK